MDDDSTRNLGRKYEVASGPQNEPLPVRLWRHHIVDVRAAIILYLRLTRVVFNRNKHYHMLSNVPKNVRY